MSPPPLADGKTSLDPLRSVPICTPLTATGAPSQTSTMPYHTMRTSDGLAPWHAMWCKLVHSISQFGCTLAAKRVSGGRPKTKKARHTKQAHLTPSAPNFEGSPATGVLCSTVAAAHFRWVGALQEAHGEPQNTLQRKPRLTAPGKVIVKQASFTSIVLGQVLHKSTMGGLHAPGRGCWKAGSAAPTASSRKHVLSPAHTLQRESGLAAPRGRR